MSLLPKIAVSALAVLVLSSCGKAATPDAKDTSSASSSSSPSASTSASSLPSSTAQPASGRAMTGNGYTYKLPAKWEDISAQLKKSQPGIDTGGRAKPATPPFTANLNTLTTPGKVTGTPTSADLDALATQIKSEVASLAPKVKTLDPLSIGGAPAVHQEGAANSSGAKFYLVQYFAIYKGNNYGLTFAFPAKSTPAQRTAVVEPVLASWTFQ